MGLLDRMKSTEADLESDDLILGDHPTQTSLSILDRDDELTPESEVPFVVRRTKYMMQFLLKDINDGSKKGKRTAFLLNKLVDEAYEELVDVPPEMVEYYVRQTAAIMYWAATGERILNLPLPARFSPAAELEVRDTPTMSEVEQRAWAAIESAPDPEEIDRMQRGAIMNEEAT